MNVLAERAVVVDADGAGKEETIPPGELLLNEADRGMIKGYKLSHGLLLAADYGVAQRRPRTIVIGSRIGKIDEVGAIRIR